jgi:hypothetical protein
MKSLAKHICLCAWILAFIAQSIVVSVAPASLVVSGTDIAHAAKLVLIHTLIFVSLGLALAVAAYFAKGWGQFLAALSAALYLVRWFPIKSVFKFGPFAVAKEMFLIGSNTNVMWLSIIGNVILPILFISVIALVVIPVRRPTSAVVT